MYHMTYLLEYWFYPFSGNPHFTGAGKGGQGGQKNWPPKFSCFIDPKGPPNQKSENKHKNLAKKRFYKHYILKFKQSEISESLLLK